ncbi:MAG TPA: protein kinase family protein [Marmoricola sp.]|nr:protein kinase family protein [Marmoricola sp.]
MPPTSMSPGSLLDNRYRLEVLLSEQDGARFWRATDTVLARSVAVHVVPSSDPRAAAVLAAAQRSAGVTDPHFLRVLDCADADGLTWVINEWGDGSSLDVILDTGTLPPMRAAWLTREVAEAIAAAHAQGLSHGRLNPEAVLVTKSGSVKIIGFMLNAAFERTSAVGSPYGVIGPREADVVDLAGILYAALTGRWPGVAPSGLTPAPREGSHPLRPRQVRAGVPRTLDAICDRVLHKEASQHVMPVETAHEIAAALSDYVGDPAAVAPVDVPSMHADPEADVIEPDMTALAAIDPVPAEPAPAAPLAETAPVDALGVEVGELELDANDLAEPAVEPARPAARPATAAPPVPPLAPPPVVRPPARPTGAHPARSPEEAPEEVPEEALEDDGAHRAADPDATLASPAPFSPSGIEFLAEEERKPAAPPPPFEQPAARPLFAEQERRVPEGASVAPTGGAHWPFEDEPPAQSYAEPPRRRHGVRTLLIVLLVIAVAVAAYLAFRAGDDSGDGSPSGASTPAATTAPPSPSASASSTPVLTGTPISIAAVGDFDPEGNPPRENPGRARLAIDGDQSTAWPTSTYTTASFGALKSGVGLVVDLGSARRVTSVQATLLGGPTDVEFYAAPAEAANPPTELADTERLGAVPGAATTAGLELPEPTTTRYLVVWLTKLPASASGFKGQIAEITVRS